MARRQKAPTPEELIEKLQETFTVFKEEYSAQLETIKQENLTSIAALKQEYEDEISKIRYQTL